MTRAALLSMVLVAATVAAAADVDPLVLRAEADRISTIEKISRSTITILAQEGRDGGSGVLISADGYALTNFHVTEAAGIAMKCGLNNGQLYDAVIVGVDPVGDVALVKLFGRDDFPAATMGDSDLVRAGDEVFVVGNPFLLATDFRPSVAFGIVSGVHRYQFPAGTLLEYADCIQTDAAINPGNSGGPLFNRRGELIGINGRGSFEKRGRVNVGVGYAISINQVKNFLGHLKAGRIVDHATLGARVAGDDRGRVFVSDILDDSDAYRRGLRYGDEVVRFGGRTVSSVNAMKNVLGIFPQGWTVPLSYRRQGELHDIFVRLAGVHNTEQLVELIEGQGPAAAPRQREPEVPPADKPLPKGDAQPKGELPKQAPKPSRAPRATRRAAAPAMPKVVRDHYQRKRGYANYFFNRENRTRVWREFSAHGDFSALSGQWTVVGRWVAPDDMLIRLDDAGVEATMPSGHIRLDGVADLTAAVDPPGSGGLLAALYLWRRMLTLGPDKFGDVAYVGTEPLAGRDGLFDVLAARHAGAECRFIFDPHDGRLVKLEFFALSDADPCELWFSDEVQHQGRYLPQRVEVRHADRTFAEFRFSRFDLKAGGK